MRHGWPVWYAKRSAPSLRCTKGRPLPVQTPGAIKQLAVGFGHPVGCALSDTADVFECVEVPTRVLALQAVRESWPKRELLERARMSPVAA